MRHFLVEINYLIPAEQLGEITPLHRTFLQTGYDKGWLLISGPRVPRTGGVMIARAPSLEELQAFLKNDPFLKRGVASYSYTEFDPVKFQPILEEWVAE